MISGLFLDGMDRKGIGHKIRKYRQLKGITQGELAKLVGSHQSNINRIENGRQNYTIDFLFNLAHVLNIPEYEIFSDQPLVPYESREPIMKFNMPEGELEGIKFFEDPLSLGPGNEISEIPPSEYLPFLKKLLPRGYKSDPDRIVAFPAAGIGMKPTINSGSIVGYSL